MSKLLRSDCSSFHEFKNQWFEPREIFQLKMSTIFFWICVCQDVNSDLTAKTIFYHIQKIMVSRKMNLILTSVEWLECSSRTWHIHLLELRWKFSYLYVKFRNVPNEIILCMFIQINTFLWNTSSEIN